MTYWNSSPHVCHVTQQCQNCRPMSCKYNSRVGESKRKMICSCGRLPWSWLQAKMLNRAKESLRWSDLVKLLKQPEDGVLCTDLTLTSLNLLISLITFSKGFCKNTCLNKFWLKTAKIELATVRSARKCHHNWKPGLSQLTAHPELVTKVSDRQEGFRLNLFNQSNTLSRAPGYLFFSGYLFFPPPPSWHNSLSWLTFTGP